ncbi:hypothetical protein Stsp02_21830 [Streptomyces sp. NBRC 14336]|uniref:hypothetical protein n=1 Tax=Streptomyces sp. NBRC 14336 TaxID=3030992 RepID=UPI0024A185EC|nr:hypothetical protein [Streptomyces sp. NBRC 14336]WBO81835.1 hypothetical protein SBE_005715 [Streptomyces sp. SBE_14.2]GLW46521.1 hypothetical protein Stsp02_21830 [Streptomyces sp. NBRC 14336]
MSTPSPDQPTAEQLVEHIAQVGRALWAASHLGSPAPVVAQLRDRMDHPQPGDLVMEFAPFSTGDFDPHSVGRLLAIERRPGWPTRYVIEPLLLPGEKRDGMDLSLIALPDQRSYARWADGLRPCED